MAFRIVTAVLCAGVVAAAFGQKGVPDLLYHGSKSTGDIRSTGLGGSGCALPEGALSAWRNPALPHAYCKDSQFKGLLTGLSYAQSGPVYDGSVVTFGGGYSMGKKGTVLNLYRYLKGGENQQTDYQAMVTYAGQMFEKSDKQGSVDYGANVRYEQANWRTHGWPDLYATHSDTTVPLVTGDTSFAPSYGSVLEKRVLLDVGFYQANVLNNLDFALVLRNLAGYVWRDARPSTTPRVDTVATDVDTVRGTVYDNEYKNTDDWIDGWYRSVTVGASFRSMLAKGKLVLRIPFELEVLGLFSREDNHTMFRCGLEAEIAQRVALRFGYAREPSVALLTEFRPGTSSPIRRGSMENENRISGGAGLRIRGLTIDGSFSSQAFGVGATFTY